MGISYTASYGKNAIIGALFLLGVLLWTAGGQAHAAETSLTVENVSVDVTAENSVAARDKAFEEAQLKAFKMLADRLVSEGKISGYRTPDPITIGSMVKDFEVTNEKLSAVRYVGTYTFRFREAAVKKYFSLSNLDVAGATPTTSSPENTETKTAQPLLVLPFYRVGQSLKVWQEGNLWLQAWGRDLKADARPVEIPIGDLMDVADIGETEGVSFSPNGLARMQKRYGAGDAAIIVAAADDRLAAIKGDSSPASGVLTLTFYRTDRRRAEAVYELALTPNAGESRAQFFARAVSSAYGVLNGNWKAKTIKAAGGPSRMYVVHIPIKSIAQWVKVQQALRGTSGVSQMSVLSLKPREAFVRFSFGGDAAALREALANSGMTLGEPYTSTSVPRFSGPGNSTTGKEIYDITVEDSRPASFYRAPEPSAGGAQEQGVHTF
ncbi:MAG: DUF2066 domain-containing protein [Alphaproteobacteria bacterium]|jgi:hypothetical protein|nr:DUF2066 domain-containing protein [Alphaproteobacteria bacterium]QQS58214.1 MAG: DUF2066 domain-containing protein [Alphaproteobacteria bacterium]